MKDSFKNYFETIQAPATLINRAEALISVSQSLFALEADDIFVNTMKNKDQIEYSSLWIFAGDRLVECKEFLSKQDVDIVKLGSNLKYYNLVFDNFDNLENVNPQSTAKATLVCEENISSILYASGKNCEYLVELSKKYFIPNMLR